MTPLSSRRIKKEIRINSSSQETVMITEETTRTIEIEVVIANKIETNAVKAMIEEEVTIIAIDNNLTRKTKAETAEEQA